LTPLQRVKGIRDVRLLAATGVVAVDAQPGMDEAVLLKTAASAGLTLRPERRSKSAEDQKKRRKELTTRWWMRPEMVLLAVAAVLLAAAEIAEMVFHNDSVALVLALLSIGVGIIYPARSAFTMLRSRRFSYNVLLVVTVVGALFLGRAGEAADLVVIFSLGAVLESYVADRARGSIRALMELSPPLAERFRGDGLETIAVEELRVADTVLVRPGSRLPTDGNVIEGVSWVDTSAVTGESMPEEVGPGSAVYGGTLNGDSALRVAVSKPYVDTVLARVIREVEEAQANRGKAQRFADQFANVYTPAMIVLAVLVASFGPLVMGLTFAEAVYRSLVVLIVSCSCALVLSVPVSVVSAVARAARDGVLIKGGAYLEQLAAVDTFAFDKTGTLTLGRPVLVGVYPLGGCGETELLTLAAGVEAGATHPIAEAIVRAARERGIAVRPLPDARTVAGVGAEARVDGRVVSVGRVGDVSGDPEAERALAAIEAAGATPVAVVDGRRVGLLGVADELRPDAGGVLAGLRRLGISRTVMLTGDRQAVAEAIAGRVGIEQVRAELMPDEKRAAVAALREGGKVAMVGDGVNDAPALATADVALVMGAAGTDVALETADVALMADELAKVPYAVSLARRARTNINQNITLSILMVVVLVTAALTGAFSLTQGVLINEGYALVIIGNGLRLLRRRRSDAAYFAPPVTRPPGTRPADANRPAGADAGDTESASCGCAPTPAVQAGPTIPVGRSAGASGGNGTLGDVAGPAASCGCGCEPASASGAEAVTSKHRR
jgi:Cd2+/Zn2+-exporting ATPase